MPKNWKDGLRVTNWNSHAARQAAKTGGPFRRTARITREEDNQTAPLFPVEVITS